MKPVLALLSLTGFFLVAPAVAVSADCGSAAQAACAQNGCVEVLSAREKNGACEIKMLVPGQPGKPPRKLTVRVGG